MTETHDQILFEAEVTPHRSLSRRGLHRVIGFLLVVSLGVTTLFWQLGAWPIAGFNGAEVLLAVALLRAHGRFLRNVERLSLSGSAFRIQRLDAKGHLCERVLAPAWLKVILQERPGRAPGLYLAARGQRVEVAAALGEPEKRDLAAALAAALDRLRHPVFDNPQLREG